MTTGAPAPSGSAPAEFDLVVLGTGAGGSAPASRCRAAGWRVAVVDDQPYGGTCALRGCDPKRVLMGGAELVDWHRRMMGHGIAGESRIDWSALMRFKRSFTDPVPARRESALAEAGIATYHGAARFVAPDRLVVYEDGREQQLVAGRIVLAVGAGPRPLGIPGEEHVRTSTEFLELEALPRRVAFVGAGYISFEFAHLVQRAGAQAIVLGRGTPLAHFDADVVERLVRHTRAVGVDLRLDTNVTAVEVVEAAGGAGGGVAARRAGAASGTPQSGTPQRGTPESGTPRSGMPQSGTPQRGGYRVRVATPRGEEVVEADLVVHGAGRVPNTTALGLAAAEVEVDERGAVRVNAYMQSVTNSRVYAAGDVVLPPGSLPLTPVAALEGLVVASNLLRGNERTPSYRGVPSVVFTVPPLASVGLTEAAAREQGLSVRVRMEETSEWYTNRRVREPAAMFKTIVEEGTDRVLGAHLLGPGAEEVVALFALAIRQGITAAELRHAVVAYPTASSDVAYML